jgi:hypothetical protein
VLGVDQVGTLKPQIQDLRCCPIAVLLEKDWSARDPLNLMRWIKDAEANLLLVVACITFWGKKS